MQEKEYIMGVRGRKENPSLRITVSLVMPENDPRDGFTYLPLTPMIDPYSPIILDKYGKYTRLCGRN